MRHEFGYLGMTKSEVNGNQSAQRPPWNLSFSAKSLNSVCIGVKNEVHDKAILQLKPLHFLLMTQPA